MGKRILMIEDDPVSAKMVRGILEGKGYEVSHAEDGMAGLHDARGGSFDLVMVDWLLPKLDGYKICKLLKMDSRFKETPVFVVTGRTEPSEIERIKAAAVDEVILKTSPPSDMLGLVEKYLGPATAPTNHQPT